MTAHASTRRPGPIARRIAVAVSPIALLLLAGTAPRRPEERPPSPAREFRAAWVATVDNIDWPSRPGLPVEQQKAELVAILDRARALNLNALIFQIRPACDALYASKLEPWSDYLTGTMGVAPDPPYDPLEMAVREAHARGLELHAWFNPYRAHHWSSKSPLSADHVGRKRPDLVRTYGRLMWLDPGLKEVQDHSLEVIRDVVRRYDIDGVHIDDYFYPYKEKDAAGAEIPFPDDPSWKQYRDSGGKLERDDWRRDNVNRFVHRLYRMVKQEKRWVRFGISPFGIWRPGNPPQIRGFDQYQELYADARKWLREGAVDYFAPQLYWPIAQQAQAYPVLLKWWCEQNPHNRHLWPGNYTSRAGSPWPAGEIVEQVAVTRGQPGATGNIHFSMKALMENRAGVSDLLVKGPYRAPALAPASKWLDHHPPGRPRLKLAKDGAGYSARWSPTGSEKVWQWVVRRKLAAGWRIDLLPGAMTALREPGPGDRPAVVAVSAVDRTGNESALALARW